MEVKNQQIQFRVEGNLLKRFNNHAKKKNLNKSMLLRTLIYNYLKEND